MDLIDEIAFGISQPATLNFTKSEAAVLRVKASEIDTSSIMFTYIQVMGKFDAIAGYNAVPNSQLSQGIYVGGEPFGPLSKILMFPPFFSNQSDILILVSS